ncbi:MAG TPA: NAD(P)-dependent oxidoreductase [Solirubrobacteraceae bacterium]|nr:NAD(P)-dependent oxidoreductase [Solirubrobacteraceae bacterium]
MTPDSRHVGMVGLGNMGGRIARRIHDGGFAISGYDADAGAPGRAGIEAEESLGALVERAAVLFFSLPDSTVIERVVYGEGGVATAVRAGQIVIDLSTADPVSSMRIHADLTAKGAEFLDAGISGGAVAAEKGTLAIMVGGSADALASVEAIVATFAANVYLMGSPGSGHTAKLLNNFLNAISLAATAEAMVAGRAAGLDLAKLLDVLNHSSGVNFATQNRFPRIIEGDYLEGGLTNDLMAKDVRLYLELLRQLGVTSFTGPSCLGAFDMASALGYGKQISNRVVDAIGDAAGGLRLQDYERGGSE